MWPEMVNSDEVRALLLSEGMPAERAITIHSEIRTLPLGARYRLERTDGNLFLLAQGTGWYRVVAEDPEAE